MKIYIVIGGNNYEGCDCYSMRWFMNKEQGEQYGEEVLVKVKKFDYYEIMEGEESVEMNLS